MKIKFLTGLAGMDAAGAVMLFSVGDVVEWNDQEAERLIAAGIAEVADPASRGSSEESADGTGPRKISSRQPVAARKP